MRLVSWNINGGPGSTNDRIDTAWHYVRSLAPDIALLQEARRTPDWLSAGYEVFEEAPGVGSKRASWGSAVLVRRGLTANRLKLFEQDLWLRYLEGYIVTAEIKLPAGPALIASVHAPPEPVMPEQAAPLSAEDLEAMRLAPVGEWRKRPKVWYSDFAYAAIERNISQGSCFIVGGDWNTGRFFDHSPHWDPPIGTAFFVRARQNGWFDCHDWLGKREEQSYFRKDSGPYQLDHVFCDRRTAGRLRDCHVRAEATAIELSDHAPLVVEFDFGTAEGDSA